MNAPRRNPAARYVNDLRRYGFSQSQFYSLRGTVVPLGLAIVFLATVSLLVAGSHSTFGEDWLIVAIGAVIGGYMALNIGANDVANNMGPAVGGKVLTVTAAILIAAVCEAAGAMLAGGDVVRTISKGIIAPGDEVGVGAFRDLMLSALFAAALWINLATVLNVPVSTTHSIVGGVLGAGVAAAGPGLVNWITMANIAASWVISPVVGAVIAAAFLYFIKVRVLNVENRLEAANKWVPLLIATMAAAFAAYMAMKGLKKVWTPSGIEIVLFSGGSFLVAYMLSRPFIARRVDRLENRKKDIYSLFDVPLIGGVALLSFAHGANDVANAVGPLAALVSTVGEQAGNHGQGNDTALGHGGGGIRNCPWPGPFRAEADHRCRREDNAPELAESLLRRAVRGYHRPDRDDIGPSREFDPYRPWRDLRRRIPA